MQVLSQYVAKNFGITLSLNQLESFYIYEKELLNWNKKINLTSIIESNLIWINHFLDSLTCLHVIKVVDNLHIIDVGSGAGFPGIPLKIIFPNFHLTIAESVKKKCTFIQHLVLLLGLNEVEIIQERVEVLGQSISHRERYDWAIARAVAVLPTLVEYLLPLVKVNGSMLAMKGKSASQEVKDAYYAIKILGGNLGNIFSTNLPEVDEERNLIAINKISHTPQKYPRRTGIPRKRPLIDN